MTLLAGQQRLAYPTSPAFCFSRVVCTTEDIDLGNGDCSSLYEFGVQSATKF